MLKFTKLLILFIVICNCGELFCQSKFSLGGKELLLVEKETQQEGDWTNPTLLEVYESGENGKKLLLKHLLLECDIDHNSEGCEVGGYLVTDSTLTLYSYWVWAGDAPVSPYGARVQVFAPSPEGDLFLKDSRLYIENIHSDYISYYISSLTKDQEDTIGIRGQIFLHQKAKNQAERDLFRAYIRKVQKQYNGRFVYGKASDALLLEVRRFLKKEIAAATKGWEVYYGESSFGYRR